MASTDANPSAQFIGETPARLARLFGHIEVEEELKKFELANTN